MILDYSNNERVLGYFGNFINTRVVYYGYKFVSSFVA